MGITASKENGCKNVCCQGSISASRLNALNENGDIHFDLCGQFDGMLSSLRMVKTEREIALELDYFMLRGGADALSFETIAVSGKNSSMPHGVPSDKKIENGDFITMDFGSVYNGYRSDMTRTVAVGFVTDEQKHIYDTVLKAQLAALNAVKAGVVCKDMDKIARDIKNRIEEELQYPGTIKVTVIRETRAIEEAK